MADFESDERDGVLFRFWIRAGSYPDGWPGETMGSLLECRTPADYRRALTELAVRKRVNLPGPDLPEATEPLTAMVIALREALAEVVDGTPAHHLAEEHAPMTIDRAREIRRLAGLSELG